MHLRKPGGGTFSAAEAKADPEATAGIEVQEAFQSAINGPDKALIQEHLFPSDPAKTPKSGETIIIHTGVGDEKSSVMYSIDKVATASGTAAAAFDYAYTLTPVIRDDGRPYADTGHEAISYLLLMGSPNISNAAHILEWIIANDKIVIIAPNTQAWRNLVKFFQSSYSDRIFPPQDKDFLPFNIIEGRLSDEPSYEYEKDKIESDRHNTSSEFKQKSPPPDARSLPKLQAQTAFEENSSLPWSFTYRAITQRFWSGINRIKRYFSYLSSIFSPPVTVVLTSAPSSPASAISPSIPPQSTLSAPTSPMPMPASDQSEKHAASQDSTSSRPFQRKNNSLDRLYSRSAPQTGSNPLLRNNKKNPSPRLSFASLMVSRRSPTITPQTQERLYSHYGSPLPLNPSQPRREEQAAYRHR